MRHHITFSGCNAMMLVTFIFTLQFLNLNIEGHPIENWHPIRNVSSVLECREFCRNHPICTAAVWNCARNCYLKQKKVNVVEKFEHCTSSWIKSPVHRRSLMTRKSCRSLSFKKMGIVVTYFSGLSAKVSNLLHVWLHKKLFAHVYHHVDSILNYTAPSDLQFCEKSEFCKVVLLQNVGREAHVYVSHILRNYESLQAFTFFIQENEFYGLERILMQAVTNRMRADLYFVAGSSHPCEGGENLGRNFCWAPDDLKPMMLKLFHILEKPIPLSNFPCSLRGTFASSREAIRSLPISKYQQIYELFEEEEKVDLKGCQKYYQQQILNSATLAAHVLERLWPIVFNTETAVCKKCTHDMKVILGDPHPTQQFPSLSYTKSDTYETDGIENRKLKRAHLSPKILDAFKVAVSNSISRPSVSVPDGCVSISIANSYHKHLRALTLKPIKTDIGFMKRFVSLCFGFRDSLGTCVEAPNIKGSDFNGASYHALLWTKWHLLAACHTITRFTLFLDSDVVMLRNPWTVLSSSYLKDTSSYHAFFQAEGSCASCQSCPLVNGSRFTDIDSWVCGEYKHCPVNGGQILVNNAYPQTVKSILNVQPCKMNVETPLDQHLFDMLKDDSESNIKTCSLPGTFAGHCWLTDRRPEELCRLTSYHTQCVSTRKEKLHWIQYVLKQTENCSTIR